MTKLKYVGNGEYLEGVPARDLSDDEVAAMSADQVDVLKRSRLYETWVEKPAPKAEPAIKAEKGDN